MWITESYPATVTIKLFLHWPLTLQNFEMALFGLGIKIIVKSKQILRLYSIKHDLNVVCFSAPKTAV